MGYSWVDELEDDSLPRPNRFQQEQPKEKKKKNKFLKIFGKDKKEGEDSKFQISGPLISETKSHQPQQIRRENRFNHDFNSRGGNSGNDDAYGPMSAPIYHVPPKFPPSDTSSAQTSYSPYIYPANGPMSAPVRDDYSKPAYSFSKSQLENSHSVQPSPRPDPNLPYQPYANLSNRPFSHHPLTFSSNVKNKDLYSALPTQVQYSNQSIPYRTDDFSSNLQNHSGPMSAPPIDAKFFPDDSPRKSQVATKNQLKMKLFHNDNAYILVFQIPEHGLSINEVYSKVRSKIGHGPDFSLKYDPLNAVTGGRERLRELETDDDLMAVLRVAGIGGINRVNVWCFDLKV
ncbi:hypothetical protein HK098_004475 [Nowakowskiella sp. JEL0407]|nr:hypothetical protein HK098_004475 [Nowakowskiella sp. JEL0407]